MYQYLNSNDVVVQKYGGTSVGTPERIQAVAERVARQHKAGLRRIALVVSAMSGETNRIVDLVKRVNPRAPARHYDMAVAAGEQVSVALVAAALEAQGLGADPWLAYQIGIKTDDFHAKARILEISTDKIEKSWIAGRIPVIAGFQGVNEVLDITTLGRGGSDTSAVAVAVALKAAFCEINTDVNGVYTADPRIVPSARLIAKMHYDVALEMASLGSKVLHSRCVEIGAKYKMPIVVRNSFASDETERTVIMPMNSQLGQSNEGLESVIVSGVTLDRNIARITIEGLPEGNSAIARVFDAVAKAGVNVDIIVHDRPAADGPMRVGFTVAGDELRGATEALKALDSVSGTQKNMRTTTEVGLAKVSVVGVGMRSYAGVASRVFTSLAEAGISIHMISTSEIKISCVVAESDGTKAMQVLHKTFIEVFS